MSASATDTKNTTSESEWTVKIARGSADMSGIHTIVLEDFEEKLEGQWSTATEKSKAATMTVHDNYDHIAYFKACPITMLELQPPFIGIREGDRAQLKIEIHRDKQLLMDGTFFANDKYICKEAMHDPYIVFGVPEDSSFKVVLKVDVVRYAWCERTVFRFSSVSICWLSKRNKSDD